MIHPVSRGHFRVIRPDVKHEPGTDHECPRTTVPVSEPGHPTHWLLAVGACAAVCLMGDPAAGASPEDCRVFHQECTEARAAGYRDVGICHVERLECAADPEASVSTRWHQRRDDDGHDPERAVRERSVGP